MKPGTLRRRSSLFGEYNLVPYAPDEVDKAILGYAQFADDPKLRRAIRLRDEWRDHNNRRFSRPVVKIYLMERPDGSPLF